MINFTRVRFSASSENRKPDHKHHSEPMPTGCCERRKLGLPVPCCPPLPPDEVLINIQNRQQDKTASSSPAKPKNVLVRWVVGVGRWFKGFFSGLWEDMKTMGHGFQNGLKTMWNRLTGSQNQDRHKKSPSAG